MWWFISRNSFNQSVNLTLCESIGKYNNCIYFNVGSGKIIKWDYKPSTTKKSGLSDDFVKDNRDLVKFLKQTIKVNAVTATSTKTKKSIFDVNKNPSNFFPSISRIDMLTPFKK